MAKNYSNDMDETRNSKNKYDNRSQNRSQNSSQNKSQNNYQNKTDNKTENNSENNSYSFGGGPVSCDGQEMGFLHMV